MPTLFDATLKWRASMPALYAQTTKAPLFGYYPPSPIEGLTLTLPEGVGEVAIVTLCVPSSWTLDGNPFFGISIDGQRSPISATYDAPARSHVPVTLVVGVPLTLKPQTIVALAGSCCIDGFATLSVIMA